MSKREMFKFLHTATWACKYYLFSFRGRINRFEFWLAGVIQFICFAVLVIVLNPWVTHNSTAVQIVFLPAGFACMYLYFHSTAAIAVKRVHDCGLSAWHLLYAVIPIVGSLILLFQCGFGKGNDSENPYGAPPLRNVTHSTTRKKEN